MRGPRGLRGPQSPQTEPSSARQLTRRPRRASQRSRYPCRRPGTGGRHDMDYRHRTRGTWRYRLGVIGIYGRLPWRSGATPTAGESAASRSSSRPSPKASTSRDRRRSTRDLHPAGLVRGSRPPCGEPSRRDSPEGDAALFQINLFWVIVSALNFILFFVIIYAFAFKPVSAMLSGAIESSRASGRRAGPRDRDLDSSVSALAEARRQSTRSGPCPEDRPRRRTPTSPLARPGACASGLLARSKPRRPARSRRFGRRSPTSPCSLPAVVGGSMTDERQRRLVEEFLNTSGVGDAKN